MWLGVTDPPSGYHSCGPRGAIAEELGPSVTRVGGVRLVKRERVCVRSETADVDLRMCLKSCWVPGSAAAVAGDQLPSSWFVWVWSAWAVAMVAQ